MFGLGARWRRNQPDRLTRLARAIEAISDADRKLIAQSAEVDRLRLSGAVDLYRICSGFVGKVNARLAEPAVLLDPPSYSESSYNDTGTNLLQINLRGRILQLEFSATAELYESDDFRHPYVLRGVVRAFNQDFLDNGGIDEKMIFYCPRKDSAHWLFFDGRTYRSGRVGEGFLISELERLL